MFCEIKLFSKCPLRLYWVETRMRTLWKDHNFIDHYYSYYSIDFLSKQLFFGVMRSIDSARSSIQRLKVWRSMEIEWKNHEVNSNEQNTSLPQFNTMNIIASMGFFHSFSWNSVSILSVVLLNCRKWIQYSRFLTRKEHHFVFSIFNTGRYFFQVGIQINSRL